MSCPLKTNLSSPINRDSITGQNINNLPIGTDILVKFSQQFKKEQKELFNTDGRKEAESEWNYFKCK